MKLFLKTEEICYSSYQSEEAYGDWSSDNSFRIRGVFTEKENHWCEGEYYELHDAKEGDFVYVLVLQYSTGDSFGCSTGNGEIVGVYKDIKIAEQARKIYMKNKGQYSIELPFETYEGIKFQEISNPAAGYFESLESLDIQCFNIEKVKGDCND